MPLTNLAAFTIKPLSGQWLMRILITDVNVHVSAQKNFSSVKAIWDTGATGSAITKKVVQQLGLVATGMANVHTANGMALQKTYTIDIGLPNKTVIQGIIATEIDALTTGCDALIGMDVITLGDFSITNHKGTTCMSFRVPSGHEIDYVKNLNYGLTPIKHIQPGKPGSNFTKPKKKRK
ncbi:MAG: retropepsin-like aspartic protease [Ginsengibacter sp.]